MKKLTDVAVEQVELHVCSSAGAHNIDRCLKLLDESTPSACSLRLSTDTQVAP